MSREENIELVHKQIEVHNGGHEAVLAAYDEVFHPDYEFTPVVIGHLERDTYRGRDDTVRWYAERAEVFETASVQVVSCRAVADDTVLMLGRSLGRGRGSGVGVDEEVGALMEIRDGRIRRTRAFSSHQEAEQAAAEIESGREADA